MVHHVIRKAKRASLTLGRAVVKVRQQPRPHPYDPENLFDGNENMDDVLNKQNTARKPMSSRKPPLKLDVEKSEIDKYKKCAILSCVGIASLLAFGSAVGALLYFFGPPSYQESMNSMLRIHTSTDGGDVGALEYPSIAIHTQCKDSFLATDHGWNLCEETCMPAECCFVQEQGEVTNCFSENTHACSEYRKPCMHIFDLPSEQEQQDESNDEEQQPQSR